MNKFKTLLAAVLTGFLVWGIVQAAEINSLSGTDASNTARFPENMAPSAVNDGARALEGLIARWEKDINGSLEAGGGGSSAYTLTPNRTISSLYDGLVLAFEATAANTATASLNVSSLGAKEIKKNGGNSNLAANDILAGQKVTVVYDASADVFQMISASNEVQTGNWTPAITFGTAGDLSVSYSSQDGIYTKVGNVVTLTGRINTSAFTHSTASGSLQITGNPFTASNSSYGGGYIGSAQWGGITKAGYTDIIPRITSNSSTITLTASGSGVASSAVAAADMPTGGSVAITFTITFTSST